MKERLSGPDPMEDDFLSQVVWNLALEPSKKYGLAEILDLKSELESSLLHDQVGIQDSYCFRLQRRAFLLATYVIDGNGQVDSEKLSQLLDLLEKKGCVFYPTGFCDAAALSHMKLVLQKLKEDRAFLLLFQKFHPPLCHPWAEELVLTSNGIFDFASPSIAHVRRAVLSACLTSLRQNVGSCFATAPAILIQQEQITTLLSDLYELLMTGKLKKTVLGIESSVPLSPSTGSGDLYKKIPTLEKIKFSPGIHAALEAAGVFGVKDRRSEKIEKLDLLSVEFSQEKSVWQPVELIHQILLKHFGLTEEDLRKYQEGQRSFLKSQALVRGLQKEEPSSKNKRCEQMLAQEKKARAAFKASTDHPLLKAWEFTLASFSESKMDFSRWNLYSSLGLHPSEKGGIGEVIYQCLQHQLEVDNKRVEQYDMEYQIAFDQVRASEGLLKNASTESEIRRLQSELTSRYYHMQSCLDLRDKYHASTAHCSTFYSYLLKAYDAKFSQYFQEIYDADLRDLDSQEYEDSPAGFRLVYKYGRSNAFLWTMIYTADQYIDALVDFFLLVEPQLASESSWEEAPEVLMEITGRVVAHVRTSEFLKSSLERIKKVHWERGETGTPWSYRSGGSMSFLLQTYYKRETPPFEESKEVESPLDLLTFLLDTLKTIPFSLEGKRLLMASPTHAFSIVPSLDLFQAGWQDDLFTYSWIRDQIMIPRKRFYEAIELSVSEQEFLLEEFSQKLPVELSWILRKLPLLHGSSLPGFRKSVVEAVSQLQIQNHIDSFLYEMLPLTSGESWKQNVRRLLSDFALKDLEVFLKAYPDHFAKVVSAKKIKSLAKAFYLLCQNSLSLPFDLHEAIAQKAQKMGLDPPPPLLFADTNWLQFYFGFVINPGTFELELWRIEPSSGSGVPMASWKRFFQQKKGAAWSILTKPFEYFL